MILTLIKIRFLQIYREIIDIGLFRGLIIFVIMLPMFMGFLYQRLSMPIYNHIITGFALFFVLLIHRQRKDYNFLVKISKFPPLTFFIEYLVFSIPLITLFIATFQIVHLAIYMVLLLPISFLIPLPKVVRTNTLFIKYIPSGLFEWKSGFRKNTFAIILFYVIGILGIYSIWFSVVSLFLIIMVISSFYSEFEPRKILEASELNSSNFLKTKILGHLKYLILFILPIFVISLAHYEYWIFILIAFLVVINLVAGAILLKYAFYYPNDVSGIHQIVVSIVLFLAIIPPISIVLLLLNFLFYFKAVQNLNNYLNAYN